MVLYAFGTGSVFFIHHIVSNNFLDPVQTVTSFFNVYFFQICSHATSDFPWAYKQLTMPPIIPTVLVTEAYRQIEMTSSEYMTSTPQSRIITGGSYHYIHWEHPKLIVKAINALLPISHR